MMIVRRVRRRRTDCEEIRRHLREKGNKKKERGQEKQIHNL